MKLKNMNTGKPRVNPELNTGKPMYVRQSPQFKRGKVNLPQHKA